MKKSNITSRFIVDFLNKKIIGTKASFDKASKGISPIYEELTKKVKAHPDFKLEIKEQKKKSTHSKRTYDGMDYVFIETYIGIQKNAAQLMSEYHKVKNFAKESKISVYPIVKKWFLGVFDSDKKGFDMDIAKQEISDARLAAAVNSGASAPANTCVENIASVA